MEKHILSRMRISAFLRNPLLPDNTGKWVAFHKNVSWTDFARLSRTHRIFSDFSQACAQSSAVRWNVARARCRIDYSRKSGKFKSVLRVKRAALPPRKARVHAEMKVFDYWKVPSAPGVVRVPEACAETKKKKKEKKSEREIRESWEIFTMLTENSETCARASGPVWFSSGVSNVFVLPVF